MSKNIIELFLELERETESKKIITEDKVELIIKGLNVQSLKIALKILDRAQTKVPVDTGFLKSTGRVKQIKDGYQVVYDANYAIYVHEIENYKHKNGQAKFLEEAYYEVMNEINKGGVFNGR